MGIVCAVFEKLLCARAAVLWLAQEIKIPQASFNWSNKEKRATFFEEPCKHGTPDFMRSDLSTPLILVLKKKLVLFHWSLSGPDTASWNVFGPLDMPKIECTDVNKPNKLL